MIAENGVRFRQDVTVGSAPTAVTQYLVDGDNHTGHAQMLEERTTSGGTTESKTYTLGHDVLAQQAETQTAGPTLTLLYDGHGSTRALLDGSGAVATNAVNGTARVRLENEAGADLSGRPGYREPLLPGRPRGSAPAAVQSLNCPCSDLFGLLGRAVALELA